MLLIRNLIVFKWEYLLRKSLRQSTAESESFVNVNERNSSYFVRFFFYLSLFLSLSFSLSQSPQICMWYNWIGEACLFLQSGFMYALLYYAIGYLLLLVMHQCSLAKRPNISHNHHLASPNMNEIAGGPQFSMKYAPTCLCVKCVICIIRNSWAAGRKSVPRNHHTLRISLIYTTIYI